MTSISITNVDWRVQKSKTKRMAESKNTSKIQIELICWLKLNARTRCCRQSRNFEWEAFFFFVLLHLVSSPVRHEVLFLSLLTSDAHCLRQRFRVASKATGNFFIFGVTHTPTDSDRSPQLKAMRTSASAREWAREKNQWETEAESRNWIRLDEGVHQFFSSYRTINGCATAWQIFSNFIYFFFRCFRIEDKTTRRSEIGNLCAVIRACDAQRNIRNKMRKIFDLISVRFCHEIFGVRFWFFFLCCAKQISFGFFFLWFFSPIWFWLFCCDWLLLCQLINFLLLSLRF